MAEESKRRQLALRDLESLPEPALDADELTPQEGLGDALWNTYSEAEQRQLSREWEEWVSGMYRTHVNDARALAQGAAHELGPIRQLVAHLVQPVAKYIDDERAKRRRGSLPAWRRHCADVPSDRLAQLTIERIISALYAVRRMGDSPTSTQAAIAYRISEGVEEWLRLTVWSEKNPALLRAYQRRLRASGATTSHAKKVLLHGYNNKFLPALSEADEADLPQRWSRKTRQEVGAGLIHTAIYATGDRVHLIDAPQSVSDNWRTKSKKKQLRAINAQKIVTVDDETLQWIKEALRRGELRDRRLGPMVCPPIPWRGPRGGGYLLGTGAARLIVNETDGAGERVVERLQGKPREANQVYGALNYLGKTAWRVRKNVLAVALEARENRIVLPDLPVEGHRVPLPIKPPDIATNDEARKAYRHQRARAEEVNHKAQSHELAAEVTLKEAERLTDEPELYFPHRCDFRGRMYPMAHGLHVQGSDLRRALLEFAHGKPISRTDGVRGGLSSVEWLAAHVAGVYGKGKLPFDERIAWTFDNENLIRRIADDPLGNRQDWETIADRKHLWQCLAASREWAAYLDEGDGFVSHLPIYVDGTCNAIQHFAALARDSELADLVNLSSSERPQDIYKVVAEKACASVTNDASDLGCTTTRYAHAWLQVVQKDASRWRQLAKEVVMLDPYGGTFSATADRVEKHLAEWDQGYSIISREDRSGKGNAVVYMAKKLDDALGRLLVKPNKVKEWLVECVKLLAELCPGAEGVTWNTPTGWPWVLRYGEQETSRTRLTIRGVKKPIQVQFQARSDKRLDVRKQKSAASPNFVHALDAAALVSALNILIDEGCVAGVAAIHDSVGALAADMRHVDSAIREGFVKLYAVDPIRSFHKAVLAQIPEECRHLVPKPPETGDFDVREVLKSRYFFS